MPETTHKFPWASLIVELHDDEEGWVQHENPAWTRFRLRRFKVYGSLGSLERVLAPTGNVVDRHDVDWTGLNDTLESDAPEIARLLKLNEEIIAKAQVVTADLGSAGLLSEVQTERFLNIIAEGDAMAKKRPDVIGWGYSDDCSGFAPLKSEDSEYDGNGKWYTLLLGGKPIGRIRMVYCDHENHVDDWSCQLVGTESKFTLADDVPVKEQPKDVQEAIREREEEEAE